MNILIISRDGELLGVADRLGREGHSVKVTAEIPLKKTNSGMYEVIEAKEVYSALKWCLFVISDVNHSAGFFTKVSMYNKPIIGTSTFTQTSNEDSISEYAVFNRYGVKIPETIPVQSITEIYKIVTDWKLPRYNIRFDRTSFTGKYSEFMSWAVNKIPAGNIVLMQEPIEDDLTVIVSGFFNGNNFISPFFVTTDNNDENKHCIVAPLEASNKLVDQNLIMLYQWLRTIDYHGPISIRLKIVKDNIYAIDMFAGFRYPDIYAILEGLKVEVGAFFNALAFGIDLDLEYEGNYFGAMEATSKDWKILDGAPILNIQNPEQLKHIFPVGVMKSDHAQEDMFVSGEVETIFTVSCYSSDIREGKKRMVRTLGNTNFPNMEFNPHVQLSAGSPFHSLKERRFING